MVDNNLHLWGYVSKTAPIDVKNSEGGSLDRKVTTTLNVQCGIMEHARRKEIMSGGTLTKKQTFEPRNSKTALPFSKKVASPFGSYDAVEGSPLSQQQM